MEKKDAQYTVSQVEMIFSKREATEHILFPFTFLAVDPFLSTFSLQI